VRAELLSVKGVLRGGRSRDPGPPDVLAVDCQVEPQQGLGGGHRAGGDTPLGPSPLERQQPTLENIFLRYVNAPTDDP